MEPQVKDHTHIFIDRYMDVRITTLVAKQVDKPRFNPPEKFIRPNEPQINLLFLPNLITSYISEVFEKDVVANHELNFRCLLSK